MLDPTFVLFYVSSPVESAALYAKILGREAVDTFPTFARFVLDSDFNLCLWGNDVVKPAITAPNGSGELGFEVTGRDNLDAIHAAWVELGLKIVQEPTDLDFGYTFTALDPDGNRLRVMSLNPAPAK